jgi:tetratricopeptide (TPR) repeat protein
MPYNILPNIILIAAILAIFIIIVRRLPEVLETEAEDQAAVEQLSEKGIPVTPYSKIKSTTLYLVSRLWHFALEAKDMKPSAEVGYRLRKMIKKNRQQRTEGPAPARTASEVMRDEKFYLRLIKDYPKDLTHYNSLGQFYIDNKNYVDAQNVYEYLVNHEPTNANYYAKLGFCKLQLRQFGDAIIYYDKSVALDQTHPNRFYNLSLALKSFGKNKKALQALRRAIELEPENEKYKLSLEELDKKMKAV